MADQHIITEPDEDFDILGDVDANPLAVPAKEKPAPADISSGDAEAHPAGQEDRDTTAFKATTDPGHETLSSAPEASAPPSFETIADAAPQAAAPAPSLDSWPPMICGKDSLAFRRRLAKALEKGESECMFDLSGVEDMDGNAIAAVSGACGAGMTVRLAGVSSELAQTLNMLLPGHDLFE